MVWTGVIMPFGAEDIVIPDAFGHVVEFVPQLQDLRHR
jgi:hypothetical protein